MRNDHKLRLELHVLQDDDRNLAHLFAPTPEEALSLVQALRPNAIWRNVSKDLDQNDA